MQLVLASSSRYRKELLSRLTIPFHCKSPDIDETPRADELPEDTVIRLAREKAMILEELFPKNLIIGSDQVALHDGKLISKPGNHGTATGQLQRFSGQSVQFLSALCVYNSLSKKFTEAVITTEVSFRTLNDDEIERYLAYERPYDCAGSFKAEGLGIALFDRISSDDPTAIIGLPLIALAQMLREHDYHVFEHLI